MFIKRKQEDIEKNRNDFGKNVESIVALSDALDVVKESAKNVLTREKLKEWSVDELMNEFMRLENASNLVDDILREDCPYLAEDILALNKPPLDEEL